MKRQLMSIIIAATLIGGTGTTVFAATTNNATCYSTNCAQTIASKVSLCQNSLLNNNTSLNKLDIQKFLESIKGQAIKNNSGDLSNTTTKTDTTTKPATTTTTTNTTNTTTNTNTTTKPATTNTTNTNTQATVASDKFMATVEQKIFQKVNEERAKAGMSTLTYNTTMEKYARIKSADMGDRNYFDHADPQGNLITAKMKNDGVTYRAWGENIAYIGGVSDQDALANQFMTNWMNSPGHKANILSPNFASMGVGVYKVGNRVYATQEFYK